jgi:hypothetical protein
MLLRRRISLLLLIVAIALTPLLSRAAAPQWWSEYGVTNSNTPNDYAAANQGQAKNIAAAAINEMDNDLPQFGGSQLDGLLAILTGTSAQTNDYAAINLGQLKNLATPFYNRLLALGYVGPPLVVTGTFPLLTGTYPWINSSNPANDYAAANIGQIKYAFSFDVTHSGSGGPIPDWWIEHYFGSLLISGTTLNPNADVPWSGGQMTYSQTYQQGLNPVDFYNDQTPTLAIVSGNNQTGAPGGYAPAALVVSVTGATGNALPGAPVTFSVISGGGQLKRSFMSPLENSLTVLANQNGMATVYFQMPNTSGNTSLINVAPGSGTTVNYPVQQQFSELTDNGSGGPYPSPFSPSNVVGTVNPDGSEDLTWQNNSDSPDPVQIMKWNPSTQSWTLFATVPAGMTSFHAQ